MSPTRNPTLPDKLALVSWRCEPVARQLMHAHKWTLRRAELAIVDWLRWLYTAARCHTAQLPPFVIDDVSDLDAVWRTYLIHTAAYRDMSERLFATAQIPYAPRDPFSGPALTVDAFRRQLAELDADWGADYVARVYAYAIDAQRMPAPVARTAA